MHLKKGFHVTLFHGLRITEAYSITEDLMIVPFECIREYIDESLLRPFSQNSVVPERWTSIGAIVTSFEWQPEFHQADDDIYLGLDWGGTFREDL